MKKSCPRDRLLVEVYHAHVFQCKYFKIKKITGLGTFSNVVLKFTSAWLTMPVPTPASDTYYRLKGIIVVSKLIARFRMVQIYSFLKFCLLCCNLFAVFHMQIAYFLTFFCVYIVYSYNFIQPTTFFLTDGI